MILRSNYTVVDPSGKIQSVLKLPFSVRLDSFMKITIIKQKKNLEMMIDYKVDPKKVVLVKNSGWYKELAGGKKEPIAALKMRDGQEEKTIEAQDFMAGLIFLSGTPASISSRVNEDRFVAESTSDKKLIANFGTDKAYSKMTAQVSMSSFNPNFEEEIFTKLLHKRAGLRIYENAIKANSTVAQFRELWRILESAFAKRDGELINLVCRFEPAKRLDFNKKEIKKLKDLRDRASHAYSKAGIVELARVDREVSEKLPRLKNLCEQVILTKKSWGYPTLESEELLPMKGFVGLDNSIVVFK